MIHAETLQLEGLRQQIQDLEHEINKLTGDVDHGRPEPKPTPRVVKLRKQSQQARGQLHAAIETVRRTKPEAITEWVNYHKVFLERIQAETSAERNADTRRGMAGYALQQWDKVAAGQQEFVYINEYFLKDYSTEVRSQAPKVSAPKEEASKSWWQFWK